MTEQQPPGSALLPDGGRYPKVTPEDVLETFVDRDDRAEPLTAPELSEELNCSRRTALNKLHTLEDAGDVASKKVGGRSRVWWVPLTAPERGDARGARERRENLDDRSAGESPSEHTGPEHIASHGSHAPGSSRPGAGQSITEQDAKAALEDLDVVGRGAEAQEVRRKAILHAWNELRERGEATTQELANSAFDKYSDHPKLGYAPSSNHYRGYTFWDSCAREVLKELPGVDPPEQRGNTWRFVGGDV